MRNETDRGSGAVYRDVRVRPKKSLGQNFLVDPAHRARIVAAAELTPQDAVLEVGPGRGEMTSLIAERAGRVVAVELDDRLIAPLQKRFAGQQHVTIVHGDILDLDPGNLMVTTGAHDYKVIANLPYYITGAALRHLLGTHVPPVLLVLTVQSEVADRIVAQPPRMSLLALSVQVFCEAYVVSRIPASAFYPAPKVDSAVLRLVRRPHEALRGLSLKDFFRVARAGFSHPRKQLRNTLASGLGVSPTQAAAWLTEAGIRPEQRAETLTVSEWGVLSQIIRDG
jgi:16S rRNA (adenine1518-N6/adenine1519-N6)-dimethyltransferase